MAGHLVEASATTPLLVMGLEPAGPAEGAGPITRVPTGSTPGHMAWALNGTPRPTPDRPAIALYSDRSAPADVRHLEMLRSIAFGSRLAVVAVSAPPLAAGVLASLLSSLSEHIDAPGLLLAALPRLERELVSLAWVDRVTGLGHLGPGVVQRALSLVPGTSFGASLTPEPVVRRLTKQDLSVPVPAIEGPMRGLVAGRSANPSWVAEFVEPALAGVELEEVEPSEWVPDWWGTSKVVEVVAHPTDIAELAARLTRGLRRSPCQWCAELIAADRCPFCRQRQSRSHPPAGEDR
jgi:hypothetical protein